MKPIGAWRSYSSSPAWPLAPVRQRRSRGNCAPSGHGTDHGGDGASTLPTPNTDGETTTTEASLSETTTTRRV